MPSRMIFCRGVEIRPDQVEREPGERRDERAPGRHGTLRAATSADRAGSFRTIYDDCPLRHAFARVNSISQPLGIGPILSVSRKVQFLTVASTTIHIFDLPAFARLSAPANLNVSVNGNNGPKACLALSQMKLGGDGRPAPCRLPPCCVDAIWNLERLDCLSRSHCQGGWLPPPLASAAERFVIQGNLNESNRPDKAGREGV